MLPRNGDTDEDDKDMDDAGLLHMSNKGDVHHIPDEPEGKWLHWPTLAAYVGPGFLVCIAYLDPGNLEADLQVYALPCLPYVRTARHALVGRVIGVGLCCLQRGFGKSG